MSRGTLVRLRCQVGLPCYGVTRLISFRINTLLGSQVSCCSRNVHTAILARGLGQSLEALPGAGKDKQGYITVPIPDPRVEVLAKLERTKPVRASVEVVEVTCDVMDEIEGITADVLAGAVQPDELSGKSLSALRSADAIMLAVPCRGRDSVGWLNAVEHVLVSADLKALEQQVCVGGVVGPNAEIDVQKFRKSLSTAKEASVRRDADELARSVLVPGFMSLRQRLRAGIPAREARAGLERNATSQSIQVEVLDPRFDDLARSWLNVLVTWKPICVLADVPERDAGGSTAETCSAETQPSIMGNEASALLAAHATRLGVPSLTVCVTLEAEVAGLQEEPDFLKDYLESFELSANPIERSNLRPWVSQSPLIARQIPHLLNLLTFFTAGEKEARAWMCPRVRKDHSALPFSIFGPERTTGSALGPKAVKGTRDSKGAGSTASHSEGVPASLASRAIHTGFETRVKSALVWKFEDLEALGVAESGPTAKERAKQAGKTRRISAQSPVEDGDVVEFELNG